MIYGSVSQKDKTLWYSLTPCHGLTNAVLQIMTLEWQCWNKVCVDDPQTKFTKKIKYLNLEVW